MSLNSIKYVYVYYIFKNSKIIHLKYKKGL